MSDQYVMVVGQAVYPRIVRMEVKEALEWLAPYTDGHRPVVTFHLVSDRQLKERGNERLPACLPEGGDWSLYANLKCSTCRNPITVYRCRRGKLPNFHVDRLDRAHYCVESLRESRAEPHGQKKETF